MPLIDVDSQELLAASARISEVSAATQNVSSLSMLRDGSSQVGNTRAAAAISSFVESWKFGLSCLAQDGDHLADLLRRAATLYGDAEQQIARAAE